MVEWTLEMHKRRRFWETGTGKGHEMMGDIGREGVWNFLGARHGGLGSVGSHTGIFIAIYIYSESRLERGS